MNIHRNTPDPVGLIIAQEIQQEVVASDSAAADRGLQMGFIQEWLDYHHANPFPDQARISELLNDWLSRYPSGRRSQLENQIANPEKNLDAISELWVYETLQRLGLTVDEVNPKVQVKAGTDDRTPDFKVSDRTGECFVEVTTLHPEPPTRSRKLERDVADALGTIQSPEFHALLRTEGELTEMPPRNKIIKPVEELLARHTADQVERMKIYPRCVVDHHDWRMQIEIVPRGKQNRRDGPLSVAPPPWTTMVNDVRRFLTKLQKKAHRYPNLSAPLVVAINAPGLIKPNDSEDILSALIGDEARQDSLWVMPSQGTKNTRVKAIWAWAANPYSTAATPRMYINAETSGTIPESFRGMPHTEIFPTSRTVDNRTGRDLEDVLNTGTTWPQPFVRHYETIPFLKRGEYIPFDDERNGAANTL